MTTQQHTAENLSTPAVGEHNPNPVYLISADLPGCGSTTLTKGIVRHLMDQGAEPHLVEVGKVLRDKMNAASEAAMQANLGNVPKPADFDPQIYGNLPQDRPCVVDGKLATTVGPQYIGNDRPIVSINLTSDVLVSAKRVGERDGRPFTELFCAADGGEYLLGHLAMVKARAAHDNGMRTEVAGETSAANVQRFTIDTSKVLPQEAVGYITGNTPFEKEVPDWEMGALRETLANLAQLHVKLDSSVHPNDKAHFSHQFESIRYNMERLAVTLHPSGIASIREQLRKSIVDCWFGLMMKQAPRFFAEADGNVILDQQSHSWTPEFYKIAEGWPVLSELLKDKSILDPFAGAGTLINLLVARNIPSSAFLSDIAFTTRGMPLNKEGHTYMPLLNSKIVRLLFDNLPSWYKPDFTPIKGYATASANRLPIKDNAVDYVVADPPYGKNCATGGIGLLLGSLQEFRRVAREGSILMVPVDWVKEVRAAGYEVEQLTTDVSRGHSKLAVCYIKVTSGKE